MCKNLDEIAATCPQFSDLETVCFQLGNNSAQKSQKTLNVIVVNDRSIPSMPNNSSLMNFPTS